MPANTSKDKPKKILLVKGKARGRVIREIPALGIKVVQGHAHEELEATWVEEDGIYTVDEVNDPYLFQQWGIAKVKADKAWNYSTGGVPIAIIDTGVDSTHEDLHVISNINFSGSPDVLDHFGHGTHCAGIAAAITNNAIGIAGVGYATPIMNIKALNDFGSGDWSNIAEAIVWAADNGAKVISMSFGGSQPSSAIEEAVNYAWNKGCILVAAAGNDSSPLPHYPAYYTNCIAVCATDSADNLAGFSNHHASWVDVAAPGVGILSTLPVAGSNLGKDYGSKNGTSMACPHVAGLAALIWATDYGVDNTAVRKRIEEYCDLIAGTYEKFYYGRINAEKSVAGATPNPPPPSPPPEPMLPVVSTLEATDVTEVSAVLRGMVLDVGTSKSYKAAFMIGIAGLGSWCSPGQWPVYYDTGEYSAYTTFCCGNNLMPGTVYDFYAVVKSEEGGYSYGGHKTFKTLGGEPQPPEPEPEPEPEPPSGHKPPAWGKGGKPKDK